MKKVLEIAKKILKILRMLMKMKNFINVKELIRTYKEETGKNPFTGKNLEDEDMEVRKLLRRHRNRRANQKIRD